jgi:hypothetical protein
MPPRTPAKQAELRGRPRKSCTSFPPFGGSASARLPDFVPESERSIRALSRNDKRTPIRPPSLPASARVRILIEEHETYSAAERLVFAEAFDIL